MTAVTDESVFDQLAPNYDEMFSERLPAKWLRLRVRDQIEQYLPDAGRVLDVGCGTGEDAIWLAGQGHTVVATDPSPGMLEQAKQKILDMPEEIRARIELAALDAGNIGSSMPAESLDLVLSNFGALNCVENLQSFFAACSEYLKPNGVVAITLMGPFCLWETAGFLLRGDLSRARRRWKGRAVYETGEASQFVWYHSPATIKRMAAPFFDVADVCGIGVFVPSTEFFGVCEHRPGLFRSLTNIESQCGSWWPLNRMGDHYLIVLRARST